VTSFPVEGGHFEPTSLPASKSLGNVAEPCMSLGNVGEQSNIVRLSTTYAHKSEEEEQSQQHSKVKNCLIIRSHKIQLLSKESNSKEKKHYEEKNI